MSQKKNLKNILCDVCKTKKSKKYYREYYNQELNLFRQFRPIKSICDKCIDLKLKTGLWMDRIVEYNGKLYGFDPDTNKMYIGIEDGFSLVIDFPPKARIIPYKEAVALVITGII